MRKMLAGFLATSMIVSIASATTFAANTAATFTFDLNSVTQQQPLNASTPFTGSNPTGKHTYWDFMASAGDGIKQTMDYTYTLDLGTATITLENGATVVGSIDITPNGPITAKSVGGLEFENGAAATPASIPAASPATYSEQDIIDALAGRAFSHFDIGGKLYSGTLTKVSLGSGNYGLGVQFNDATALPDFNTVKLSFTGMNTTMEPSNFAYTGQLGDASVKGEWHLQPGTLPSLNVTGVIVNKGSGQNTANISGNLSVQDVIVCDGEGNPIPLTEDPSGVDKDINDNDGVQSDTTVYFMIKEKLADKVTKSYYDDDNYYKIRVNKGDNAKMVKKAEVVYKNFKNNLYDVVQGTGNVPVSGTSGRHRFIKVELNPNYTTDEFKIILDMRLTPTADAVDKNIAASDDELKIKDFSFYMKNIERAADNDWRVGINGMMLKPLENDWNDVTWFDEDGDVAHMKFFADSDIDSFYSKLSTKWEHADYASYFNDQDAFIFNFTGSPKLSSTSRADLEIFNPFVDEDGNETIDPATAVIYQVIDGDLYDITDSFQYKEAENGEMAFVTRTRFLGTYIICEKAVEEAVSDDETVPDELTPDTDAGAPEETTPDNNGGGKTPANTGKYL